MCQMNFFYKITIWMYLDFVRCLPRWQNFACCNYPHRPVLSTFINQNNIIGSLLQISNRQHSRSIQTGKLAYVGQWFIFNTICSCCIEIYRVHVVLTRVRRPISTKFVILKMLIKYCVCAKFRYWPVIVTITITARREPPIHLVQFFLVKNGPKIYLEIKLY